MIIQEKSFASQAYLYYTNLELKNPDFHTKYQIMQEN